MKQIILTILFSTIFAISISQAQFAGGSGTEEDPYQIETVEQLQEIRNYTDKHFIQTADIDASETENWNDGKGFKPIGKSIEPFNGSYSGNDYSITGLAINRPHLENVGLFGYSENSKFKKIQLIDIFIIGGTNVGGLIGVSGTGKIDSSFTSGKVVSEDDSNRSGGTGGLVGILGSRSNVNMVVNKSSSTANVIGKLSTGGLIGRNSGNGIVYLSKASGNVSGNEWVGGLVGTNGGIIEQCHASGNVETSEWNAGGLVGFGSRSSVIKNSFASGEVSGGRVIGGLMGGTIGGDVYNSYASGDVTGEEFVGGLIGLLRNGLLNKSYSTGTVSSNGRAIGGLIGQSEGSTISYAYSQGDVYGDEETGGLVGFHSDGGLIKQAYSTGTVNANELFGGFIGLNKAHIKSSYWNSQSNESMQGVGQGHDENLIGLNTDQMTGLYAFENMKTFNFHEVWYLTDAYPVLSRNNVEIINPPPLLPVIFSPEDNQINVSITPTLTWSVSELADSYHLKLSEESSFSSTLIDVVFSDTSYVISDPLESGETFYWKIKTINESGESDWSETRSFTTLDLPAAVNLKYPDDYMLVIGQTVETTWSPSQPNIQTYHLELAVDGDFATVIFETNVNETSFSFDGLDHKQQYWWRVKAENSAGLGQASEARTFYAANYESVNTSGEIVSGVSQFTTNVFFTSSMDDRVYSFDRNGNVLWTVETGGELQSTVSVDREGNSFVGSTDTRLYAFDKDGIPLWDRALGGTIRSSPSISSNAVYVGISTGRFFAFSKDDGEILWSVQTGDAILSSASINNDGTIYFGSNDGKLYAVASDGNLLWSFETDSAIVASPALTLSGEVVIPSTDGYMYKIDGEGEIIWRFETDGAIRTSPVIDSEGIIYFGSSDGSIYAIDADGLPVWEYETGSPVNGTPALSQNGYLGIGTGDGRFYLIDQTGELIWFMQTGDAITAPALFTSDYSTFISSKDGNVYIIKDMVPQEMEKVHLAESVVHEWSTFKGSNRRTGNQEDIYEVSVEDEGSVKEGIPTQFTLEQNYPNPFNPATKISYSVPEQANVRIEIFNSLGQRVAILVNETKSAGRYEVSFDATDLSSGLYLYRMRTDQFVESRQMLFVK